MLIFACSVVSAASSVMESRLFYSRRMGQVNALFSWLTILKGFFVQRQQMLPNDDSV